MVEETAVSWRIEMILVAMRIVVVVEMEYCGCCEVQLVVAVLLVGRCFVRSCVSFVRFGGVAGGMEMLLSP